MAKRSIALPVAAIGLMLTTGCQSDGKSGDAAPSTAPTTASPTPAPTTPTDPPSPVIRDTEVACGGTTFNTKKVPAYNPGGPPYAGNGTHYALLAAMHDYSDEDHHVVKLPAAWQPQYVPGMYPQRFTQLLVCVYQDSHYRSRTVDTCKYEDSDGTKSTAKVLSARYRYRVLEAKTGRQITTFTLMGSVNTCPAYVYSSADSSEYYQIVLDSDLAAKLRPYVVGPARSH